MIRVIGLIVLSLTVFLMTEYFSIDYYDYEKNKIQGDQITNVDSAYAVVDRIGFVVALKTNVGPQVHPYVLIFGATLVLTGLLLLFSPIEFPLKSINSVQFKSFAIMLLISSVIFVSQYLKYFDWSSSPGWTNPLSTLLKFTFVTMTVALVFILINKRSGKFFTNEHLIIWLVLASIMIANGLLIETYSWTNPTHHGDMAQHDWLEVAVYTGWSHNWTIGYTVFRASNNILMILGIVLISVMSSRTKETT